MSTRNQKKKSRKFRPMGSRGIYSLSFRNGDGYIIRAFFLLLFPQLGPLVCAMAYHIQLDTHWFRAKDVHSGTTPSHPPETSRQLDSVVSPLFWRHWHHLYELVELIVDPIKILKKWTWTLHQTLFAGPAKTNWNSDHSSDTLCTLGAYNLSTHVEDSANTRVIQGSANPETILAIKRFVP